MTGDSRMEWTFDRVRVELVNLANRWMEALAGPYEERVEVVRQALNEWSTIWGSKPPTFVVVGDSSAPIGPLVSTLLGSVLGGDVSEANFEGGRYAVPLGEESIEFLDLRQLNPNDPGIPGDVMSSSYVLVDLGDSKSDSAAAVGQELVSRDEAALVISRVGGRFTVFDPREPEVLSSVSFRDGALLRVEIASRLPERSAYAFARLIQESAVVESIANQVVRRSAATAAAIATIPLPVADIVPIVAVQTTMVAGLAHLGGRRRSTAAVLEFVAALGINMGVGLVLRELVRALVRLVPIGGPMISSGIAAGATQAIGELATRHFCRVESQNSETPPDVGGVEKE
jgi:uncharacterized protein (DUF697 family)